MTTQASLSENERFPFDIIGGMSTKGSRIKAVRNGLRLTQDQFAEFLGEVSRGAVGNWERDQGIKQENLELISGKTGVSLEWLATGRGSMDPTEALAAASTSTSPHMVRVPDLNIFGGMGGGGMMEFLADPTG